jgi:hypothetical protein
LTAYFHVNRENQVNMTLGLILLSNTDLGLAGEESVVWEWVR